jgi:hypothetical protein
VTPPDLAVLFVGRVRYQRKSSRAGLLTGSAHFDPNRSSVQAPGCKRQSHNSTGQSFWLTPASCAYPPFLFRVIAHRRGGRELGPPCAERKTMIMREGTGDDVGISSKLD